MNSLKKKAIAAIASIVLGASLLPVVFSSPASGATNNGTATLTQSSGTGATNFTINLGGSASCPGDGNAGYRWQTFMIPAAADIDATLTFGSGGPTAVGSEFRVPLFDTNGSPVVSKLPDIAVAPATTGGISGIPNFNFQVFSPTNIPNGTYKIGVACTLGVAGPTQLKSYWSQRITITNDPTNTDNAKIDWTVAATDNGTATLTQSSGTGATNFTINLGGSASCPGDGNAGYRWQTFMIPAAADLEATLTFGSGGPTAVGSEFRVPLFDTNSSPVVSKLPDIAVAPATTGGISGIPNFNFQVFLPGDIPNGTYKIGVACTLGVAGPTQLKSFWSQRITIANDPTNTDNAKIDWVVGDTPPTTTTTAAPTTTTTAAPTTTTTAAPTTTTTAAPTTTTTTAPPTPTPSFTAITPSRVFDTRPGEGGLRTVSKVKISGLTELRVKMTDLSGLVPASGVGAVSLNVTVTEAGGSGYVTVYPCGTRPNASSLNYTAGQTIPNAVIAPVSAQGEVCFFSTQPTHILADVNGWFAN